MTVSAERPYVAVCMPPPLDSETVLVHEHGETDSHQSYVETRSTHPYALPAVVRRQIRQPCITNFAQAPCACRCGRFDLKRLF